VSLKNNPVEVQDNIERASGKTDATTHCHYHKVFKKTHPVGGSMRLASPLAGVGSVYIHIDLSFFYFLVFFLFKHKKSRASWLVFRQVE
jgi:hypothetical protein